MSKFRIINLIDKLFISCSIFLIIYAWVNFYLRNLWITFILSLIFTAAILFIMFYLANRKQAKTLITQKQANEINNNFLCFKLSPTKQKINLLNEILTKEYTTTLNDNFITYLNNNKKHVTLIATQHDVIVSKNFYNIINEFNNNDIDVIEIICNEIEPNLNKNVFINKEIKFITKKILYLDYFLKYNIFPDSSNINFNTQKYNFQTFIKNLFTPQKAKGYFFCGAILIFSSIILPYHYYYIIVGTILLLFSIICKLLPIIKD